MRFSIRVIFLILGLLFPGLAAAENPLSSISLEAIRLLRIAPSDERAVIKTPDGKLKVIKVGDVIGNKDGHVIEIAAGRVVIEEKVGREIERVIIRLEGDKQRMERIKKEGEAPPPLLAPQTKTLEQDPRDRASGGSFTQKPSSRPRE